MVNHSPSAAWYQLKAALREAPGLRRSCLPVCR